jgi:hypothetical protein
MKETFPAVVDLVGSRMRKVPGEDASEILALTISSCADYLDGRYTRTWRTLIKGYRAGR